MKYALARLEDMVATIENGIPIMIEEGGMTKYVDRQRQLAAELRQVLALVKVIHDGPIQKPDQEKPIYFPPVKDLVFKD